MEYDFSGWATKNDLLCSDGRTIRRDAFRDQDGETVPLVWSHDHKDMSNVIGHALLENREEGVYAYCTLNETPNGKTARELVKHGDLSALSIYANKLKQRGKDVMHGTIRELSLVLAGANPGAFIDTVIAHSDEQDESAIMYLNNGEEIVLAHADLEGETVKKNEEQKETQQKSGTKDDRTIRDIWNTFSDKQKKAVIALISASINGNPSEAPVEHGDELNETEQGETIGDVFDTLTEEQKTVAYVLIAKAAEAAKEENKKNNKTENDENEEDTTMHHNAFDTTSEYESQDGVLTHADQEAVLRLAKSNSCGSLRDALEMYAEQNDHLAHGIDEIETLFPEYKNLGPAAPEMITSDQGWIGRVMSKVSKSPYSRVRTRQMDVKSAGLRSLGYQKGKAKKEMGNVKLLKRTTDPQTIYVKDSLNRDDIIDVTDFDVVTYNYKLMRMNLNEELATAIMISDGRDDGDEDKISEEHIRSIYHDDELYTIHKTVDIAGQRANLQGTDTAAHFGDNYVYAEAIIEATLDARIDYKGSGNLDFYCTPTLLNKMLLARDLNGRRIYNSKSDLEAALNVASIQTVEQFAGVNRMVESTQMDLLGIFVNLNDYQVGATKGGEISQFNQFDIDFNKEKFLIETRCSGALTRIKSAIVLEMAHA